jgi:diadenylate cyclase
MLENFRWQDLLDIFIVAFILYRVLLLMVDTRAMQLVKGILVIGATAAASKFFDLKALSWLLERALGAIFIAIPIVFQPELRRMLEELGRGRIWKRRQAIEHAEQMADDVTRAISYLQGQSLGAILVFQRETGLADVWRSAVRLNAEITQELIVSIFWPNNPLHDGAAIIDRSVIVAAACYLPLTSNTDLSRWYGTRHRAALGVTEVSDAIALVVSEERGEVALATNGHLSKGLKEDQVHRLVYHYFMAKEGPKGLWDQLREEIKSMWREEGRDGV